MSSGARPPGRQLRPSYMWRRPWRQATGTPSQGAEQETAAVTGSRRRGPAGQLRERECDRVRRSRRPGRRGPSRGRARARARARSRDGHAPPARRGARRIPPGRQPSRPSRANEAPEATLAIQARLDVISAILVQRWPLRARRTIRARGRDGQRGYPRLAVVRAPPVHVAASVVWTRRGQVAAGVSRSGRGGG